MSAIFANYSSLILFLHVIGAVIWIGGMIAIKMAVHPTLHKIEDEKVRLNAILEVSKRLFSLVLPSILIIIVTGLIMAIALDGHHGSKKLLFIVKEAIWTIMAINYTFMVFKLFRAKRYFKEKKIEDLKATMAPIPKIMLPINILLGMVAIFIGILIRGF